MNTEFRPNYAHIDFLPNITQTSSTVGWLPSKLMVDQIFSIKSPKYP